MPVKVRCPACEKVLNAPDSARGKAVKCPGCEAKVSVPAAGATGKTGANPAVKPKKKAASSDSDSFLANLDIDASVDTESRTCPKCGADLGEDETQTECPKCGIDARTGQLSARVARKRSLKGADPNDYYGMVFRDAWRFPLGNIGLIMLSAATTLILILFAGLLFFIASCLTQVPPRMFSIAFGTAIALAVPGWYFHLTLDSILATISKKSELRSKFDMVTGMASGMMFVLWLAVFFLPVWAAGYFLFANLGIHQVTGDRLTDSLVAAGITYGMLLVLMPFAPPALAHLSSFSTYRGWIMPLMARMAFKNFGQSLLWVVLYVIAFLPFLLVVGTAAAAWGPFAAPVVSPLFASQPEGAAPGANQGPSVNYLMLSVVAVVYLLLTYISQLLLTWGTLYNARALGQYTFYCKEALDLVTKAEEHVYKKKDVKLDEHGRPITPLYVTIGSIVFFIVALSGAGYFVYIQLFKG
jgi:hypothetical protein